MLPKVQRLLKRNGLILKKYPFGDLKRRMAIIRHFKVNKIVDVGANTGQFALKMRELGFQGHLISFEPLHEASRVLAQNAARDQAWTVYKCALGNESGSATINVSAKSDSSSLLDMLPQHEISAATSVFVGQETIRIKRLEDVLPEFCGENDSIYLKIDTQGYEKNVLDGAVTALSQFACIQLEMSLVPLYAEALLMEEMIAYLGQRGFKLYSLEPGFSDKTTGQLLQTYGVFVNEALL